MGFIGTASSIRKGGDSDTLNGKTESQLSVYNSAKLGGKMPSELSVNMDLLWENASPQSAFSRRTITFKKSIKEYKSIAVFLYLNSGKFVLPPYFLDPNKEDRIFANANYVSMLSREMYIRSDNTIEVNDAVYSETYGTFPTGTNNGLLIPAKIVGIK